ncbi:hypothetical protein QJS04_geneDACA003999 [Acorus gramineus]|uniref:Uncharacterized protein n=1 Tax=Acorus gramineus TaxID=55184 RepID=A0AAV9BF88_ACOGR|nr:hypothetical protein QJS04_geneDACA003999 [Acorus gramineus]
MDQDGDTMFEFYKDFNSSEMCAAEDIFFCGKLLPLRPNQANEEQTRRPKPTHRRKLESFDEFNGGTTIREYLKGSSESRRLQRTTSQRPKPKWYVIVFGSVKVPGEMEMSDIRSRQMRRKPVPPPLKTASVNRGSAWRLLQSLSCKGHDIAASVML